MILLDKSGKDRKALMERACNEKDQCDHPLL